MPPSEFQARVLRIIAANRVPHSHIAGGLALNMELDRLSADIDIFHDAKADLVTQSAADAALLEKAGLSVRWLKEFPTFRSAEVTSIEGSTVLDWAVDSDFRFFEPSPDPLLGWRLHPFDLATNKALAAAARREPRDTVDLVEINDRLFPLGAVAWAAVAKDPGFSPLALLDWIGRFGRYRDEELKAVATPKPLSAADLSARLRQAIDEARTFVEAMPGEQVGSVYLEAGKVVQPDPKNLSIYERRDATRGGVWPIDPAISPA